MLPSNLKDQINAISDELYLKQYLGTKEIRDQVEAALTDIVVDTLSQRKTKDGVAGADPDILKLSVNGATQDISKLDLVLQFGYAPEELNPLRMELMCRGKATQLHFQPGKELPAANKLLSLKRKLAPNRALPSQLYGKSRFTGGRKKR